MVKNNNKNDPAEIQQQFKEMLLFRVGMLSRLILKKINMHLTYDDIPLMAEQIPVLLLVYDKNGTISQQFIADKLERDKGGIHRSVKSLIRQGLLITKKDSIDQRNNIVSLTDAGVVVCNKVMAFSIDFNRHILGSFTEKEQSTLIGLLEKISSLIEK